MRSKSKTKKQSRSAAKRPLARRLDKALAAAERADPALRRQAVAAAIDPAIAAIIGIEEMPLEQSLGQWA